MRICLDVRYRMESGASSYIRHVVPEILNAARGHEFVLVKYPGQTLPFEDRVHDVILSPEGSDAIAVLWTWTVLPVLLRTHGIDVYHAMKMPGPVIGVRRTVVTMHSIFDDFNGTFPVSLKTRLFLSSYGNFAIRRADRLISVSEFVTDLLTQQYGRSLHDVDTIRHGISPSFRRFSEAEVRDARRRHGWPDTFVLAVGNVTPVKNHLAAVRAFAALRDRSGLHLLIAGGTGHSYAECVRAAVRELGLSDRVRLVGFVSPEVLPALMNAAQMLWMPSLTEGLPVTLLEAFGCGLPAITSRRGGLAELAGSICPTINDPDDHEALAAAAAALLRNTDELREISERSLARAREFSWPNAGRLHLATYERVARAERPRTAARQAS